MEKKEDTKQERQRGFGDRRRRGRPQGRGERDEEQWYPITKLGRLVKGGLIEKIEEIYKFALPIKGSVFFVISRATNHRSSFRRKD